VARTGTPDPRKGDAEIVAVVGEFAALPLDSDRVHVLADLIPGARAEQATLRELPPELEPHAVFDPRWD
jgi:hypothetical protein